MYGRGVRSLPRPRTLARGVRPRQPTPRARRLRWETHLADAANPVRIRQQSKKVGRKNQENPEENLEEPEDPTEDPEEPEDPEAEDPEVEDPDNFIYVVKITSPVSH